MLVMKVPSGPPIHMVTKSTINHYLVPKHEKITAKEKEQLLKKYDLATVRDLPKIFKKDAAISEFEPQEEDVIKITRESPTAGTAIFYRVVVDD